MSGISHGVGAIALTNFHAKGRRFPIGIGPGRRGLYTWHKTLQKPWQSKQLSKPGYIKPNIAGSTHDFKAMRAKRS